MIDEVKLLQQWAATDKKLDKLNRTLESYRAKLENARDLTGMQYDGMPHGSQVGKPTEEKALSVLEIEETYRPIFVEILLQIQETVEAKKKVDEILKTLPPFYEEVASARYAQGLRWWEVADALGYSEQYVKHIHTVILKTIRDSTL